MRKISPVFLSVAAVVALAPANASPEADSEWGHADAEMAEEGPASRLLQIKELWQTLPLEMAEELQEFRASLDEEFAARLVPTGAAEPGWKTKGIDLPKYLESLPGGIDDNALLTVGEVPMLRFFGKISADILADWEFIQAGSEAVGPTAAKGGDFLAISPHHIIFVANEEIQTGNARCMKTAVERAADHATVYRYAGVPFDPDSDASLEAEAEAIVLHALIGGLRSPVLCSIVERDGEGQYRHLSYTPSGRPLADMDDPNDHLEFTSSIDLYQLLNVNYSSEAAGDEPSDTAEEATEAL
ncbi:hypothetical protein [uncultured Parasphingorhabdus sp.]|uniref:hypothetical protein n=1 Tax=uncultured Parasphingorhabdus sp. TaxID=2709694 RepID=UPI0030D92362|tara:strand:+ start:56434 stop:57333 length:900 start_codon:yes stop_codon:yes gene_type:complete